MKTPHAPCSTLQAPHSGERGIALVMTLAILALVTILLIAFVVSMRVENTAAKNYNDLIRARQLAQGAVDQAVSAIRQATPTPTTTGTWVAVPGLIVNVYSSGFRTNLLYTTSSPANSGTVDLNTGFFITGTNSFYNSFANAAITAGWQNVTAPSGELIGRVAYWVDVDATKVNINTAKLRDPVLVNDSNPTNIDLRALDLPFYNAAPATIQQFWNAHSTSPGSLSFNSIQEMRRFNSMSQSDFLANQFYVTVGTTDTNIDAFGRARVDITAITSESSAAYTEAYSRLTNTFWATMLYPDIITGAGSRRTFKDKYGEYGVRQILANIIDYQVPYTTPATGNTGNNPFFGNQPNLDPATGIPQFYSGLKKGPNLNEIIVHVATNAVGSNLVVRAFVDVKLSNGYTNTDRGNGYVFKIEPASILVFHTNPVGSVNMTVGEVSKTSARNVNNYGEIGSFTAGTGLGIAPAVPEWQTTINGSTGVPVATGVVVKLKRVRLLTPPGADANIVDWMTQSDFDTLFPNGMKFPDPTYNSDIIPYVTPAGNVSDSPSFSYASSALIPRSRPVALGKNDPRTRTFLGLTSADLANAGVNFQTNWVALGAGEVRPNNARAVRGHRLCPENYQLLADARFIEPGSGASVSHIWLDNITEQPFKSLGELTYLHTGYPWRSIRFRSIVPQISPTGSPYPYAEPALAAPYSGIGDPNTGLTTVEANAIPDWVLFDIFTIGGTPTYQGRLNVNTQFSGPANTLAPRLVPLAALINNVSTNLSTTYDTTFGTNIINAAGNAGIAYNMANRVFVSGSPYTALPAYFTPGEICEVNNLGYFTDTMPSATYTDQPSKERRQQLIRRISNLVTSRTSTFVVWGIAESIKEVGTPNPNGIFDGEDFVTGQVKVQAIIQRYDDWSTSPPLVKFRTLYYRFIYE